jgi:hypothetical protein
MSSSSRRRGDPEEGHAPGGESARNPRNLLGGLASMVVILCSWTFPRIGVFKLSEFFAVLASPRALMSGKAITPLVKCYFLFVMGTAISLITAIFALGKGSPFLSSDKGFYARPEFVPFITLLHVIVYLMTVAVLTIYFSSSDERQISGTLCWAYYATVLPGLLQIFRIVSGIHFNVPWFERADVGPFSGVFNSGYLRVMGFEIEPLAYASSLIAMCCLSMYNGRRKPWLGIIVLLYTYGFGALLGLLLAFIVCSSKRLSRNIVPVYALGFTVICWYIYVHVHQLLPIALVSGSLAERIGAIYSCVAIWLDHPMGVGLGFYGYFFNRYNPGMFAAQSLDFYPNNDPGMFLVYGGPLFLIGYLYTFHYVLNRSRSYWLTVAAVALLFQSGSAYLYFNPALAVIFSMLLAGAKPLNAGLLKHQPVKQWITFLCGSRALTPMAERRRSEST